MFKKKLSSSAMVKAHSLKLVLPIILSEDDLIRIEFLCKTEIITSMLTL